MSTVHALLERLERVTGNGPWMARCPAHRDRTPSLSIAENPASGAVLLHCHAGCGAVAVLEAIGLRFSDLYPPRDSHGAPVRVDRDARRSLQTIAHASLVAATVLGQVVRSRHCSEAHADLMVRLAVEIHRALDAAGVRPAVLSERGARHEQTKLL